VRPTLTIGTDAGETVVPGDRPFVVGRGRSADLTIDHPQVSRRHVIIEPADECWAVRDLSSNGTWRDDKRVGRLEIREPVRLRLGGPSGPHITLISYAPDDASHYELPTVFPGSPDFQPGPRLPDAGATNRPAGAAGEPERRSGEPERRGVHKLRLGHISVGRSQGNDIVVGDLLTSRMHAEIFVGRGGVEIVDLESANGTFVNGTRVERSVVTEGDVIAIGHHIFRLVGDELVEYIDTGQVSFEADGLNVFVDGTQLLHDMSFRLPGGSLLAVIGPSGAGKSTLLNALTGFRPADTGVVRYAGRDLYADYDELRRRIGYVPQDDILHTALTVREALEYGAELRFPADTTAEERGARVNEVLEELGLTSEAERLEEQRYADGTSGDGPPAADPGRDDLANRRVANLSGGQRKRTSVALELLTRPTLLYLDEPTSGLDPGLDKEVMACLRKLADGGRTVIVVTHSVAQLDKCDYVLALAQGGHMAYFGPPQEALSYFNEGDWADIFQMLKTASGSRRSVTRFRSSRYYVPASVTAPVARPIPADMPSIRQQRVGSQIMTLSRRYLRVIAADPTYLRILVIFPFLLGAISRLVPAKHGLSPIAEAPNFDAQSVLLLVVLGACFMGSANAIREIVKEREIYRRERAIGLSRGAYLASKIGVLTVITAVQSSVFTIIAVYGRLPSKAVALGSPMLEMLVAVIVLSWSSAMIGLLVSATLDNADKMMPMLVLLTTAQLVFSGGIVPLAGEAGLEQASYLFSAKWGFAAVSAGTDLNGLLKLGTAINPDTSADTFWKPTASIYLIDIALCIAYGLITVFATYVLLGRLDPRVIHRRKKERTPVAIEDLGARVASVPRRLRPGGR
jgi:ABC-type multidrug transport system ATPase subunit/pSer/pThr/pTyr-binding forkhead associated (FHA) protein